MVQTLHEFQLKELLFLLIESLRLRQGKIISKGLQALREKVQP